MHHKFSLLPPIRRARTVKKNRGSMVPKNDEFAVSADEILERMAHSDGHNRVLFSNEWLRIHHQASKEGETLTLYLNDYEQDLRGVKKLVDELSSVVPVRVVAKVDGMHEEFSSLEDYVQRRDYYNSRERRILERMDELLFTAMQEELKKDPSFDPTEEPESMGEKAYRIVRKVAEGLEELGLSEEDALKVASYALVKFEPPPNHATGPKHYRPPFTKLAEECGSIMGIPPLEYAKLMFEEGLSSNDLKLVARLADGGQAVRVVVPKVKKKKKRRRRK